MSDILAFLQQRCSAPKLVAPAPDAQQLSEMFKVAFRAPDHAWLRPWRFLVIRGERREALGELFEQCLLQRNPGADEAARAKARNAPLRAPLLVIPIVCLTEHPKVPHVEQRLSAGCATQGLLLAAEALGFAGIWRTGDPAFDPNVMAGLGMSANEEIIGFLYLGTRDGACKGLPVVDPADHVVEW
jgi:nitroreductase